MNTIVQLYIHYRHCGHQRHIHSTTINNPKGHSLAKKQSPYTAGYESIRNGSFLSLMACLVLHEETDEYSVAEVFQYLSNNLKGFIINKCSFNDQVCLILTH